MAKIPYPTTAGAIEIAHHLGIAVETIFQNDCQDWEYTYPQLEQLPTFIRLYQETSLSDQAKRVLGCFIFQSLEYHLENGGEPQLVVETLNMLFADFSIHEPEFRYWSILDSDEDVTEDPMSCFHITQYTRAFLSD